MRKCSLLCFWFLVTCLQVACGDSDDPISPMIDTTVNADTTADTTMEVAVDTTADTSPGCPADPPIASTIAIGVGQRLELALPGGLPLTVAAPPSGWLWSLEGDLLTITAPYDGSSTTLDLQCGADEQIWPIAVELREISWQQLPTWEPAAGPLAREHAIMWIDEDAKPDTMFLFGGFLFEPQQFTVSWDLWEYDLVQDVWTDFGSSDAAPQLAANRAAPAPEGFYLHGGSAQDMSTPAALYAFDISTRGWTDLSGADTPPRQLGAFIYDAPRDRYISACGLGFHPLFGLSIDCSAAHAYDPFAATWETLATAGTSPPGRYGFFYAYDSVNERIVLFGGAQTPTMTDPVNPAHDTWALELDEDPPRWELLAGDEASPAGRRNGCWALDAKDNRLFIWGGTADAMSTTQGLHVLDLDSVSVAWVDLSPPGDAPARSSCSAVYDGARDRVLFGFGNDTNAIYVDLWALEL